MYTTTAPWGRVARIYMYEQQLGWATAARIDQQLDQTKFGLNLYAKSITSN